MSSPLQNIEYTFRVIKLGRDFLRGLMKLKLLAKSSEVQVSSLAYSTFIDNWCHVVALMVRKLESYNGGADHDIEIKRPILVIKPDQNAHEVSCEN